MRKREYWWQLGLIALVYVVAAKAGLALAYSTAQITAVWPPSGMALVALWVFGYRYIPAVWLGALVANLLTSEPLAVAGALAIGNTLEAVVCVYLLRRWVGFTGTFDRPRLLVGFAAACAASTTVAATIGSVSLALGGLVPWTHLGSNWRVYWAGDLLGDLLVATFLLISLNWQTYRELWGRRLEAGLLAAGLLAASVVAFTSHELAFALEYYVLLPFMIWAALRFWMLGVASAMMIVATVAIWATVNGFGYAGRVPADNSLLALLAFVFVLSGTMLFLAMAIETRRAAEAKLLLQTRQLQRVQAELRDANRRVTGILETVLENDAEANRV